MFKTDIANLALGHLGVSFTVSDLDADDSNQAKVIRRYFNTSLETILSKYEWGFSTAIAPLNKVEDCPQEGLYAVSYRCPVDCLKVLKIGTQQGLRITEDYDDERIKFEEAFDDAGTLIYTDLAQAYVKYAKRVDDGIDFPNHVGRAIAAQLAMDIAPSIITNNFSKVKNLLMDDAKREINDQIAEELNRKPRPTTSDSRFVRVR